MKLAGVATGFVIHVDWPHGQLASGEENQGSLSSCGYLHVTAQANCYSKTLREKKSHEALQLTER